MTVLLFCFRIGNTFATLFWSLFGISSPKSTDLVEDDFFIETVGQGLFMSYHVSAIVVLINMLIAMMTKSFQVIEVGNYFFWDQFPFIQTVHGNSMFVTTAACVHVFIKFIFKTNNGKGILSFNSDYITCIVWSDWNSKSFWK